MATLTTLFVDGNGVVGPRAWDSQAFGDIDEGIGAADGTVISRNTSTPGGEDADTSFTLANVDSDLGNMDTFLFNLRWRVNLNSSVDDDVQIGIRVMSGATVLAASTSGGAMQFIAAAARTPTTLTTTGATAFGFVNTTATKAQWDAAEVEFENNYVNVMAKDTNKIAVEVDTVEFTGTYTTSSATTFTQEHSRIRGDDEATLNANAGGDWAELEDVDAIIGIEIEFRIRFSIAASAAVTEGFQLRAQKGGAGGYLQVFDDATPWTSDNNKAEIAAVPSDNFADLAATTELLTAAAGSFVAGDGNHDSVSGTAVFAAANDYTEMEWVVLIRKTAQNLAGNNNVHNADGDFWDFRVYLDSGVALDTYDVTPRVTVGNRPGHIGGTVAESARRNMIVDKDGNIYYCGEYADRPPAAGGSAEALMHKSTDGNVSFNVMDAAGEPTDFQDIESIDMHYVAADDTIYIGAQLNNEPWFFTFRTAGHASPDTWDVSQVVDAGITADGQIACLHKRSDGTIVMFYNEEVAGPENKIRYRIRTSGGVWGSQLNLDGEASTDIAGVKTVMDDNDLIHIFYHAWNGAAGEVWYKSLNSSDVLLATRVQVDQGGPTIDVGGGTGRNNIGGAVLWDDDGTERIGLVYQDDVTDDAWWNESATSSIDFSQSTEVNVMTDTRRSGQGGAHLNVDVVVDQALNEIWMFGIDLLDSTANLKYNQRIGGTWQGDTDWKTNIHKDPKLLTFTHLLSNGGQRVIGVVYFDLRDNPWVSGGMAGVMRYDEIVLGPVGLPNVYKTGVPVDPFPFTTEFKTVVTEAGLVIVKVEGETVQIVGGDIHALGLVRLEGETEQISEGDIRVIGIVRQEDETIQIAEGDIRVVGLVKQEGEIVQVPETDIPVVGHIRVEGETIQIPEGDLHILGKIKLENETVEIAEVDIRVVGLVRQEDETVQITEGDLRFLDIVRQENETVQLVEVDIRVLAIVRQDDRTVQIGEGDIPVVGLIRQEDDTVQISEADLHILGKIKLEDESLDISEGNIRVVGLIRQEGETVQIPEGDIVVRDLVRLLAETEQISEGDIRVLGLVRLEAETEQIAEADIRVLGLVRQEGETEQITEGDLHLLGKIKQEDETVQIVEDDLHLLGKIKQDDEVVQITEADLSILGLVRQVDESVQVNEGDIVTLGLVRIESETLELPELDITVRDIVRIENEIINIVEGVITALDLIRIEPETIQITEGDIHLTGLIKVELENLEISEGDIHVIVTLGPLGATRLTFRGKIGRPVFKSKIEKKFKG